MSKLLLTGWVHLYGNMFTPPPPSLQPYDLPPAQRQFLTTLHKLMASGAWEHDKTESMQKSHIAQVMECTR